MANGRGREDVAVMLKTGLASSSIDSNVGSLWKKPFDVVGHFNWNVRGSELSNRFVLCTSFVIRSRVSLSYRILSNVPVVEWLRFHCSRGGRGGFGGGESKDVIG